MIDENEKMVTVGDQVLLNIHKYRLESKSLTHLLVWQTVTPPQLEKQEPLFSFLYDLPSFDEKDLYALSLEREPREVVKQ